MSLAPALGSSALPTLTALRRRRLPVGLAWLLALALLGSQGLARWHGMLHGPGALATTAHGAVEAASTWFDDHDAGSASCRLLDQLAPDALGLASVDAVHGLPPTIGTVVAAAPVVLVPPWRRAHARAPPRHRGWPHA